MYFTSVIGRLYQNYSWISQAKRSPDETVIHHAMDIVKSALSVLIITLVLSLVSKI